MNVLINTGLKFNKMKKAQSQVVATVLLILVVISAIVIIMSFIIPFVNNQVKKGDCFNVINEIEIKNNPKYTCYDETLQKIKVQVEIGNIADKIKGFKIVVGGAGSKTYIVDKEHSDTNVKMIEFNGEVWELPGDNEARTYEISSITEKPDSLSVYPILLDGDVCDTLESLTSIVDCVL